MPCGIRSQPLRDLDQVVRIEHRCRSLCCFERVRSVFETQILLLQESLSEAVGRSLIGGDLNSKSTEWDEARLDRRGILVGEMVARNDLIVLNQGKEFTFRRGVGGSIINQTIAAPRFASRIGDWSVLEETTLSDHRCIEFNLEQRRQAVDKGRGSEGRSPSWKTRRLCKERAWSPRDGL